MSVGSDHCLFPERGFSVPRRTFQKDYVFEYSKNLLYYKKQVLPKTGELIGQYIKHIREQLQIDLHVV
jgi:hypothetical protein